MTAFPASRLPHVALCALVALVLAFPTRAQDRPAGEGDIRPVSLRIDAAAPDANRSASEDEQRVLVQDFEGTGFPPAGWTRFEAQGGDTRKWEQAGVLGNLVAYSGPSEAGIGVVEDWLVTPLLAVTAAQHTLTFDMAQEAADILGSTYTVALSTGAPDQPGAFNELASWTETMGPNGQAAPPLYTAGYATYTVDLSAYQGQQVYIAFVHENAFGDAFVLDNVSAPDAVIPGSAPGCATNLTPANGAANVPSGTVTLAWSPPPVGAPPSGYRIDIGTDPGATNIATGFDVGNNTSVALENTAPSTTYFYRVTPYNGAGEALGCQIVSFTTAAPIAAFPYTEGFGAGATCTLPTGWSHEPNPVSGERWRFVKSTPFGAASDHTTGGGCFAAVNDAAPDNAPTSLLSPAFDLTALAAPTLSFWVLNRRIGQPSPRDNSQLYVDVTTNDGAAYTLGVAAATSKYGQWTQITVSLAAYAGQPNVRLRFRAIEANPGTPPERLSDLSLDDVVIREPAAGAAFAITPGSSGTYDFGTVTPCAGQERIFTIVNVGAHQSNLAVTSVRVAGNASYSLLSVMPTLPAILRDGESVSARVGFLPTTAGPQTATLTVTYALDSGPSQTYSVVLTGRGDTLGANAGEGDGYVWGNSTLCSAQAVAYEAVSFGTTAGDNQVTVWDQGNGNDGFVALDLAATIGSFRFYGEDYQTLYLSSNGYVFFDFGSTSPGPPFPATTTYENAYIAALGDDLDPSAGGAVFYRGRDTDSDGNADELVITFFRVPRFNVPSEFATFQIILRRSPTPGANGTVRLQYLSGPSPDDGQPLAQGFNNPGSFNADARVGITGDQGFMSIRYRDSGSGGVLFGSGNLAVEFAPRVERVFGTDVQSRRAGWRMLSAPTAGMTVADLAEQNLVQGIPDEYPVDANGNPAAANIYTAYSGNTGFQKPSGLAGALTPGKGFIWYLYNIDYDPEVDASIFTGDSQSYPLPAPVVAAGATQAGDVTVPLASAPDGDGIVSELLGNPFAADLDISTIGSWTTGSLASTVGQVWDPGTRSYVMTSALGDVLPVWQGAFFENDTATEITYPIAETVAPVAGTEAYGTQSDSLAASTVRRLRFELAGETTAGQPTTDQALLLEFSESGADGWDLRDATKLSPLVGTYAIAAFEGTRGGAVRLKAQESRPAEPAPFEVPLHVEVAGVTGELTLMWALDGIPEDWQLELVDLETDEHARSPRAGRLHLHAGCSAPHSGNGPEGRAVGSRF